MTLGVTRQTAQGAGLREGDSARRRAARGGQRKAPSCESGIAKKQDVAFCMSHECSERRSTRVTEYCAAAARQSAVDCKWHSNVSGLISRLSELLVLVPMLA
eukprot:3023517-Pleurochrysis_carterae.AAC.1